MITTTVLLDTISAVKTFVSMASECDYEIDLQDKRHLVDGKSIMGIFSLDLSGPAQADRAHRRRFRILRSDRTV